MVKIRALFVYRIERKKVVSLRRNQIQANKMKRIMTAIALVACMFSANAQTRENVANTNAIEQTKADRMALKELVDVFSCLADTKEVEKQVLLFTEDATVDSYRGDSLVSSITGRKDLARRFGDFLAKFETVYHINGQQVVNIDGDTASGTAYCQVVLISNDGNKRTMLTQGVRYDDEYVKRDGRWLIAHRTSHFMWSDSKGNY